MIKAIIYARISRRDNDKTSIPNQIDDCHNFATAAGWEIVATHVEPGESGENLDRPKLTQIRTAAREHACDVVLISALDRLTRDIDDAPKMLDAMLKATKEYLPQFFGKRKRKTV